jgi:hypothetical protein
MHHFVQDISTIFFRHTSSTMKRQKVTSDSIQSTPNEEREFWYLDDDKEDGIGMFDYICSLATHGFYYMKQKKIL